MPKHFRRRKLHGSLVHVFETDSDGDYLRYVIDEIAEEFRVPCDIAVIQQPGHWLLVEVARVSGGVGIDRAVEIRFEEFVRELAGMFKTFYHVRETCSAGYARAWRVRHLSGQPWM